MTDTRTAARIVGGSIDTDAYARREALVLKCEWNPACGAIGQPSLLASQQVLYRRGMYLEFTAEE